MATIGQALTTPEAGWQRFDDSNNKIIYTETQAGQYSGTFPNANYYNGSIKQIYKGTIKFKFNGTKLRLIALKCQDPNTGLGTDIFIDGVSYGKIGNYGTSTAYIYQAIIFEKTDLTNGLHTVEISSNDGKYFSLDAVDVDGNLLDYNTIQKSLLKVGSDLKTFQNSEFSTVTPVADTDWKAQGIENLNTLFSTVSKKIKPLQDVGTLGTGKQFKIAIPSDIVKVNSIG